jgi:hypothetical protein
MQLFSAGTDIALRAAFSDNCTNELKRHGAKMTEMETDADQPIAGTKTMSFQGKFISGGFGLAKTYWLFGALPSLLARLAILNAPSADVVYWIAAAMVVYQVVLFVAVFNAARNYRGLKLWPVLAVLMIGTAVINNAGLVLAMRAVQSAG